jgi:hypothetical protein
LSINEDLACNKIINSTNVAELKILENIYLKLDAIGGIKSVRYKPHVCLWENRNIKTEKGLERTEQKQ